MQLASEDVSATMIINAINDVSKEDLMRSICDEFTKLSRFYDYMNRYMNVHIYIYVGKTSTRTRGSKGKPMKRWMGTKKTNVCI